MPQIKLSPKEIKFIANVLAVYTDDPADNSDQGSDDDLDEWDFEDPDTSWTFDNDEPFTLAQVNQLQAKLKS